MTLVPAPADDHILAHELATRAGELLLELRASAGVSAAERWALRDDGDLGSHHFLVDRLREERPGDRVLSEEGAEDRRRIGAERVWIVDPLDGTREYGEPGRSDWAVHVALWSAGRLTASDRAYQWMNVLGAIGFIVNSGWNGAIPSAALNVVWAGIGMAALWKIATRKGSSTSAT